MNLLQLSYQRLFPNQEFPYQSYLEYNRKKEEYGLVLHLIPFNLLN